MPPPPPVPRSLEEFQDLADQVTIAALLPTPVVTMDGHDSSRHAGGRKGVLALPSDVPPETVAGALGRGVGLAATAARRERVHTTRRQGGPLAAAFAVPVVIMLAMGQWAAAAVVVVIAAVCWSWVLLAALARLRALDLAADAEGARLLGTVGHPGHDWVAAWVAVETAGQDAADSRPPWLRERAAPEQRRAALLGSPPPR
ncbi:hypothetical protein [Nocardiopsis ansamitocini]|uniref:Uncharacterized protein n=1 Tax=Nocardiopsis ansamitocini TaxID=1670832 RepID=A0A9W6P7M6_9ACTN|nr:hypothetical protein [Nocardiopsis ansamitocini]GLU48552.1 hypothetical protein Nans01_29030 [Nocardiopsis ansamitocini]